MKYSDIAGMSLNRLKKAVVSGELSVPEIKTAYTSLRRTAMQRERRVGTAAVVKEFGNTDREYFRKPSIYFLVKKKSVNNCWFTLFYINLIILVLMLLKVPLQELLVLNHKLLFYIF